MEGETIKHTALLSRHQQIAVNLVEHHGWQVPACFTAPEVEAARVSEAVGLADVSWMAKFDLKGYGLDTPPALGERARCWRLGPRHFLVICEPPAQDDMFKKLEPLQCAPSGLSLPPPVYVTEVSSVYAQFLLAGPRSRQVVRKLTSLDLSESSLPDLSCGQASVAHVHAVVLRQDIGRILAFYLLVGREYGEYVWDSVTHAGHEFGLAPFGLRAQELLKV